MGPPSSWSRSVWPSHSWSRSRSASGSALQLVTAPVFVAVGLALFGVGESQRVRAVLTRLQDTTCAVTCVASTRSGCLPVLVEKAAEPVTTLHTAGLGGDDRLRRPAGLSDRYGARVLSTAGVGIATLGAAGLLILPADFGLPEFVVCLLMLGAGMGLFSAPNTAQIMSAVPAAHRGAASGMRATIWNAGLTISQAVFFTILITGLSKGLAPALQAGVSRAGLSPALAAQLAGLRAGSAILAAILGYDPISHALSPAALAGLPAAAAAQLVDPRFFAGVLAEPFVEAVRIAFAVCVALGVVAGAASLMRGSSDRRRDAEPAPASARGSEAEVRAVAGVAG